VFEAKATSAPSITLWGTGTPRREFLHADDCADALIYLMKHYSDYEHVNVGSGTDIAIKDLALLITNTADYQGDIAHDLSKPDGTMRKLMDNTKIATLGWHPKIALENGVRDVWNEFSAHATEARAV
jgi:GDP-L-fucose synthase